MTFVPAGDRFCIYAHSTDNGTIFYIGKGKSGRPYEWGGRSNLWMRKVIDTGFHVEILAWYDTAEEALHAERQVIMHLQPECNITGTKRGSAKIAARWAAMPFVDREYAIGKMLAAARSPKAQENRSAAQRLRVVTTVTREKMRKNTFRRIESGDLGRPDKHNIRNLGTGCTYGSASQAAIAAGTTFHTVIRSARTGKPTMAGVRFEFVTQPIDN